MVFLILLAGCATSVIFGQNKKDKKAIRTFKIKSITETVTNFDNGKESTRKDSYTVYDKNANILENEEYRKDGTLKHKESHTYDSNGNKTEEMIFDAADTKPNPEKYNRQVVKYDINDNKSEMLEYDAAGKLLYKTQYSYNSRGDRTFEATFDPAGKLIRKIVYTYDSKGLKVEKKEYDGENKFISSRKYQYQF